MEKEKVLGIDIGPNSIGWAVLEAGEKARIVKTGVHVFEAGLADLETDGKGKSRSADRREKRGIRRLIERRTRRLNKLAGLIQRSGLLPDGKIVTPDERNEFFTRIDLELDSPYVLRARALKEKLSPHELGRALYHLCQRRGFLSNRKSKPKKDDAAGKVKQGINELKDKMREVGAETYGEYFSSFDHASRIRGRYTARKMYEDEFEKIWASQKEHHPATLTDDFKKKVYKAIYYQRPLKNQKNLIGYCELEKDCRRAPWAILQAQRLRYLQRLNDLEMTDETTGEIRKLSEKQRKTLIDAFESRGDLSFGKIRTLLKLKKFHFNLEEGGEKKLPGNRTYAKLMDIFGERWSAFTEDEREAVVEDMRSIVKDETLKKRGVNKWNLDEEHAEKLSQTELEEGHCSFSRKAIEKLLPFLEKGIPLQTAIRELYPARWERGASPLEALPPIRSEEFAGASGLRNPIVERALTELRRVVNAVVKKYGKPDKVRVELARELRLTSKQRESAWKRMRQNEKAREKAAAEIIREAGITKPSSRDKQKYILWAECGGTCPYTGRPIALGALFGDHPQFDIEHIIPFDRSLDDSFFNKTLCHAEENRNVKQSKTPFEAYSGTDKWDNILGRVKKFSGDAREEKLKRFKWTEEDVEEFVDGFTTRQLNDTRYSSRLAKRYLSLLYGGLVDDGIDSEGRRKVQATGGQATASLRNVWSLNLILGDGPGKSRDDHRHHAVDAIAVALTDQATVTMLSRTAKLGMGRRLFGKAEPPWVGFLEDVRASINEIKVSRRVSKRVRGALHNETFYGKPRKDEKGKAYVHARVPLSSLSEKDITNEVIVDKAVRERVQDKLMELGEKDPKKAFKLPENHPWIGTENAKRPIHKVRIHMNLETFPVGSGQNTRHVVLGSNHHMEIFEIVGKKGVPKWDGAVISMYEAHERLRKKTPVIKTDHGEGKKFIFSLAGGEIIELDGNDGGKEFFAVRGINYVKRGDRLYPQVSFVKHNDARKKDDIIKANEFYAQLLDPLRKRNCRKVAITPLGEIRNAND